MCFSSEQIALIPELIAIAEESQVDIRALSDRMDLVQKKSDQILRASRHAAFAVAQVRRRNN